MSGTGNPDAPAGWYPTGDGSQRYWDGQRWTEHTAPAPAGAAENPMVNAAVPYQPQQHLVSPVTDLTSDDRTMGMLAHLLALVAGWLGPLILWLAKKDQSAFIDYHGKESLNFQISMTIYWLITIFASFVLIGLLFIPVLIVCQILFPILAGVAANKGEYYKYPLTIRLIT